MRVKMKRLTFLMITVLLILLSGCSEGSNNAPGFEAASNNVTIWEAPSGGKYCIKLFFEVVNTGKERLHLAASDFDIVDENGKLIDVMKQVTAYPPMIESGETAVYSMYNYTSISDINMVLKAIPHIKAEESKLKLKTLPMYVESLGNSYAWGVVENNKHDEYKNIQIAIICRRIESNEVIGVLTTKIDSIKSGGTVEFEAQEPLIQGNWYSNEVMEQHFAYLEPDAAGGIEEGQIIRKIITLVLFVLLIGGVVWLQVFLSKRKNKWLGLILPLINLVSSLIPSFSTLQAMSPFIPKTIESFDEYGNLTSTATISGNISSAILSVITVFLIYNISTLIFMVIYWICRRKQKGQQETH